jgi:hypothetical protein
MRGLQEGGEAKGRRWEAEGAGGSDSLKRKQEPSRAEPSPRGQAPMTHMALGRTTCWSLALMLKKHSTAQAHCRTRSTHVWLRAAIAIPSLPTAIAIARMTRAMRRRLLRRNASRNRVRCAGESCTARPGAHLRSVSESDSRSRTSNWCSSQPACAAIKATIR